MTKTTHTTKATTTAVPKTAQPKKVSQGLAIAALILNILVLPGLGTIIGGRTKTGIIQLVVFLVSIPLMFIFIGFPIAFAMWIWALVTGVQIIQESE